MIQLYDDLTAVKVKKVQQRWRASAAAAAVAAAASAYKWNSMPVAKVILYTLVTLFLMLGKDQIVLGAYIWGCRWNLLRFFLRGNVYGGE